MRWTALHRIPGLVRKRFAHSTFLRSSAAVAIPVLISGCTQGILNPRGPIARAENTLLIDSVGIMLTIVVPVIAATLVFAWWYRASNRRAQYRPTWAYSGKIEIVIWSIPAMIIMLLGGVAWISSHDLDPARPLRSSRTALKVQVVALDWKWLFHLPRSRGSQASIAW